MAHAPATLRPVDRSASDSILHRILTQGAESLTDPELLALLLAGETDSTNHLSRAEELLQPAGALTQVFELDRHPEALDDIHGRGVLLALREIAARLADPAKVDRPYFESIDDAGRYLNLRFWNPHNEILGAAYLDCRYRLLDTRVLARGNQRSCQVDTRMVVHPALNLGATALSLFHNHPSEDPTPSLEDLKFTRHLKDACDTLDIQLCDHVILAGPGRWVSLFRQGVLLP
jgi:DNA repair protein RadC